MFYINVAEVTIDKFALQKYIVRNVRIFKITIIEGAVAILSLRENAYGIIFLNKGLTIYNR